MHDHNDVYEKWLDAKEREKNAIDARRLIEDELVSLLGVDLSSDGSKTYKPEGYKVKTTVRINRTVDAEKLQEIAADKGLSEHLGELFKWRPSINLSEWKKASAEITEPLTQAITAKPGRPSFTIEKE